MKRIQSLDGLKAIMCICIVIFHWGRLEIFPSLIGDAFKYMFHCVEVFFAISGFGMTLIYRDRIQKQRFRDFIVKKTEKFFFINVLTQAVCFIMYYLPCMNNDKETIPSIINNVLQCFFIGTGWLFDLSPYNVPAWFISVLVLCYIYFFIVCKMARKKEIYFGLTYAIIMICVIGIYFKWNFPLFYYYQSLRGILSFFVGVLIAEGYRNKKYMLRIVCSLIVICVFTIMLTLIRHTGISRINLVIICLIIIPVILLTSIYVEPCKRILSLGGLLNLSDFSMDIFFWHHVVLVLFKKFFPTFVGFVLYLISSIVLGYLSYCFIEPVLNRFHIMKVGELRGDGK